MPQPKFTSRKPPPAPFDLVRATLATTPHPRRRSIAVPATSETKTVPNDTRPPGRTHGVTRLRGPGRRRVDPLCERRRRSSPPATDRVRRCRTIGRCVSRLERVTSGNVPGHVQSIERAAAVLRLLADGRLALVDLSNSLGLAKGTVHGILRTLQHVGFVEQDPESGKYQLGVALLQLGTRSLDVNELRSRALNWADSLAAHSGEAVRIGSHLDGEVLVVHHVFRPDDSVQIVEVGSLLPLHASALGKAIAAFDTSAISAGRRR